MKILAATVSRNWEEDLDGFRGDFYNVGYDFNVRDDHGLPKIEVQAKEPLLPNVEISTSVEDGHIYFSSLVKFPDLDSDKLDYYDSIHYWISKWEHVGSVLSDLNKFFLEI